MFVGAERVFRDRTGYNGLCRSNRKGEFNVPFGKYRRINYETTEDFEPYRKVYSQWEFN